MNGCHTGHDANEARGPKPWTPARIAFWGFLAVALFFLITEHRAHLYGVLPYLFLMACPLMHLFHHHGGHRHHGGERPPGSSGTPEHGATGEW